MSSQVSGSRASCSYREEFDIEPADLRHAPTVGVQHREWSLAVEAPRRLYTRARRAIREPHGHFIETELARVEGGIQRDRGIEL